MKVKTAALAIFLVCYVLAVLIVYFLDSPQWLLTLFMGYALASAFSDIVKWLAK